MSIIWLSPIQPATKYSGGRGNLILIDDIYAYIVKLVLPSDQLPTRDIVKRLAQEKIPESLDDTIWDYIANQNNIQVVALVKSFADEIKKQKINIRAIEPVSYALTRLVNSFEPTIVAYQSSRPLLIAIEFGQIVATEIVHDGLDQSKIDDFISYTSRLFTKPLSHIIISGSITDFTPKFPPEVKVESRLLNPVAGIRLKSDFDSDDSQNLQVSNTIVRKNYLPIVLILIIIIASALIFILPSRQLTSSSVVPSPTSTPSPTSAPIPSPTAIPYKLQVLNGSGRSGEAKILSQELQQLLHIGDISSANAPTKYSTTTIIYKESVALDFIDLIDSYLQKKYTVTKELSSDSTIGADLVIIIGAK